jgi:hypothetical protein
MLFTEMKGGNFGNEECDCVLEGDEGQNTRFRFIGELQHMHQKKAALWQRDLEPGHSGKIERSEQEVDVLLVWQELLLKSGTAWSGVPPWIYTKLHQTIIEN